MHQCLRGSPLDRGAQPYQDFDLLLTIRDFVVHQKPEHLISRDGVMKTSHASIGRELRSRRLLPDEPIGTTVALLDEISEPAVAAWAIATVVLVAREVIGRIPAGPFGECARQVYGGLFV